MKSRSTSSSSTVVEVLNYSNSLLPLKLKRSEWKKERKRRGNPVDLENRTEHDVGIRSIIGSEAGEGKGRAPCRR
jgi:hypothetical protein